MVAGVALRENTLQQPPPKIDHLFVGGDHHTTFINRHGLPVQFVAAIFSVHRLSPCYELRRINHVCCAAWMNDRFCVGQMLHQRPGTPRVIEVHVRQKYSVHVRRIYVLSVQCIEHQGNAVIRSGVYKSAVAILDDHMDRIEQRPNVVGVDCLYAVFELGDVRRLFVHEESPDNLEHVMVETGNIDFQRVSEWPC